MLNRVKSLRKIQFQQDNWPLGGLALMNVLETPSEAVLNRPTPEKTVLITMDAPKNHFLKTIRKQLGQKF